MSIRKVIVIDKETDTNLGTVCNAALKNAGMEVYQDVNAIIYAVTDEWEDEPDLFFDEDED